MSDFSGGFLWGSATAAHQVEGGNTNSDWWQWEHTPGGTTVESSGDGIDHWHRYDEKFALLEWSRIEPAEGEFSRAALDHYARVLESLARHGLSAFATLYHFTLPQWFAARGGWLADGALDLFGRYIDKVAHTLGDLIPYACTVNEPQIVALQGYWRGAFPPGRRNRDEALRVNSILAAAHRTATAALRSGHGRPKVGTCLQLPCIEPLRGDSADDIAAAEMLRTAMVDFHIDDLRLGGDVGDFVGLQYYTRFQVDATAPGFIATPAAEAETTQMGWEVYPEGFGRMLRRLVEAGLPIVVTENGIATADDNQRMRFLAAHLHQLKQAMDAGVDVRGYMYWSSFDNFELAHGYRPTFGLIAIDRGDHYRRVVRPSAVAYGTVARSRSLDVLLDRAW
jgi:beta-glucosidase